jgi:hypothetical protein
VVEISSFCFSIIQIFLFRLYVAPIGKKILFWSWKAFLAVDEKSIRVVSSNGDASKHFYSSQNFQKNKLEYFSY